MSELPATISAQIAQTRQNVALAAIKSNADAQKKVADILLETISNNVPVSSSRGGNVNLSA